MSDPVTPLALVSSLGRSGLFYRSMELKKRASDAPESSSGDTCMTTGDVCMTGSTNIPCRMGSGDGSWFESLSHDRDACDTSACAALLINHDPDQIAGPIKNIEFDGTASDIAANVDPDARMGSGISVRSAIKSGALRGVSIGYQYEPEDCVWDDSTRTLSVNKWRMLEATLTPIPADTNASLRSRPAHTRSAADPAPRNPTMPDPVVHVKTEAQIREAVVAEAKEVSALVRSVGLAVEDFEGLTLPKAQEKALADIAKRDKKANPTEPVREHIVVGEEAEEKIGKRMAGAIVWGAGPNFRHTNGHRATESLKDVQDGNTLRGRPISDMIRITCRDLGLDVTDWTREQLAKLALGNTSGLRAAGRRNAGNISTGFFNNFVFLNALTKAVSVGYQMGGKSIKYEPIVSHNYVPDYKQYYIGTLATANLQQTVENAAFPELIKSEGVYNNQLKMWGGTISLSEQALVTDDTGRFMDQVRMAGLIAKKTIDKRVFQKLLSGTDSTGATSVWTNNTTAGTIIYTTNDQIAAARQNLGRVKAALMNKVGLDGNPTGNMPSYLIVPATRMHEALGITGERLAPGQQSNMAVDVTVVASPWLEFAPLAGFSPSSYYLLADPNEVTGLVLSTLLGYEEPRVEQYDPGAVAAYNWKIYMPFEADLVQHTVGGIATIAAAQQGT